MPAGWLAVACASVHESARTLVWAPFERPASRDTQIVPQTRPHPPKSSGEPHRIRSSSSSRSKTRAPPQSSAPMRRTSRAQAKPMRGDRALLLLASALALGLGLLSGTCSAKEDHRALLENVSRYGDCMIQAIFSFVHAQSLPPTSELQLKASCELQTGAFKCIKDKSKGSPALLRRGLVAFVNTRSRHHKKYCTNSSSEQSRKFVAATKCLMERKFEVYRGRESEMIQTLLEVARRNYTDPAEELKRVCCTLYTFKRHFGTDTEPECGQHRQLVEELASTIVSEELELVCDDDEKLARLCPKLEPLQFKRLQNFKPNARLPPSALGLYLIATLGEPNDPEVTL